MFLFYYHQLLQKSSNVNITLKQQLMQKKLYLKNLGQDVCYQFKYYFNIIMCFIIFTFLFIYLYLKNNNINFYIHFWKKLFFFRKIFAIKLFFDAKTLIFGISFIIMTKISKMFFFNGMRYILIVKYFIFI